MNITDKDLEIIVDTVDTFDEDKLLSRCIARMPILARALRKYKVGYSYPTLIAEEMANAYIVLKECELIFDNSDEVQEYFNAMIARMKAGLLLRSDGSDTSSGG